MAIKFKRYDDISGKVSKYNRSPVTPSVAAQKFTKDAALLEELEKLDEGISSNHYARTYILSPSFAKLVTENATRGSKGETVIPSLILAPIGAITEDIVSKITRDTHLKEMERVNEGRKTSRFGFSGYSWNHTAQADFVKTILSHTIDATSKNENYFKGLEQSLTHMTKTQWDERTVYLFLALNAFLGHNDSKITFAEFVETKEDELEAEFYSFNGMDNKHTELLVEKWESRYIIIPQVSQSIKVTKIFEPLTQEMFLNLLNKMPGTNRINKSAQVSVLEAVLMGLNGNQENVNSGVAVDMLAKSFQCAEYSEKIRPSVLMKSFSENLSLYTFEHTEQDVHSSTIVKFLVENANKFSQQEILSIVSAVNTPDLILSSGKTIDAKVVLYTMIKDGRDPVEALKFVVDVVTDFDDSLPTKKMWLEMIENDKETEDFDAPASITLRISGGASKRKWSINALNFRNTMKEARKNPDS